MAAWFSLASTSFSGLSRFPPIQRRGSINNDSQFKPHHHRHPFSFHSLSLSLFSSALLLLASDAAGCSKDDDEDPSGSGNDDDDDDDDDSGDGTAYCDKPLFGSSNGLRPSSLLALVSLSG